MSYLTTPSADWRMLITGNAAGTNGLTCLPKHGGARDNKCLVTHLMTDVAFPLKRPDRGAMELFKPFTVKSNSFTLIEVSRLRVIARINPTDTGHDPTSGLIDQPSLTTG
jgi:hypothetical protein